MIRTVFVTIVCLFCINLFAQTPRKALVEHFTQASCPPCATINPVIHPIMERNNSKLTRITYQVSWPGFDPMNKDNPGEVATRVSYYGVSGVPSSFLDAYNGGDPRTTITDASLQAAANISSPYEIKITNILSPDHNSVQVNVEVTLTGQLIGRPMLRVAVLEKKISWLAPPGTNGEKEFHHVFKKYLPSASGTNISELNTTGNSKIYSFIYKFDKLYDFRTLETAAFIQDDQSKEVMQSEHADVNFILSTGEDAVIKQAFASKTISDSLVCGTSTSPTVKVLNMGTESIKTLDFAYRANDGVEKSYRWSGSISSFQEKDIPLPGIEFLLKKENNKVDFQISRVNDKDDVKPINNFYTALFKPSPMTTLKSSFEIRPLSKPDVVSFVIRNSKGAAIISDGPFTSSATKTYDLTLEANECYVIEIDNNTTSLNGTFRLLDENKNVLINGRISGTQRARTDFGTYTLVNNKNVELNDFQIFPNPLTDESVIEFTVPQFGQFMAEVIDLTGRVIYTIKRDVVKGKNQLNLNRSDFSTPGIYFIRLHYGSKTISRPIIIK